MIFEGKRALDNVFLLKFRTILSLEQLNRTVGYLDMGEFSASRNAAAA